MVSPSVLRYVQYTKNRIAMQASWQKKTREGQPLAQREAIKALKRRALFTTTGPLPAPRRTLILSILLKKGLCRAGSPDPALSRAVREQVRAQASANYSKEDN